MSSSLKTGSPVEFLDHEALADTEAAACHETILRHYDAEIRQPVRLGQADR